RDDDGNHQGGAVVTRRERCLEHDPEKWTPVFGKDHAPPKCQSASGFNMKRLRSSAQGKGITPCAF
ncbi:MAG TPA: hypothetical protein VMR17_05190, partial [Xanthobacteraceae bacterium]|nr:hypothetical protein [Xanthobacteraceae bacterium]